MNSTTVMYHAAVFASTHRPDDRCGRDECRAPAEFAVGCADFSGALVADVLGHTCAEHLAAAVRVACADT